MKGPMKMILAAVFALMTTQLFAADMLDRVQADYSEAGGKALIAEIEKSNSADKDMYCGIVYHNLANGAAQTEKREGYATKAISLLSKYRDGDAVGRAYLGSAITIMGGVSASKKKLMDAVKGLDEGAKLIDSAVEKSPESISVRMVRIQNAVGVSKTSPMKRWTVARTDVDFLKKKEDKLNNANKADLYYYSGEVYIGEKKTNEALKDYSAAVKFAPESASGVLARKALAKYSE